MEADIDVMKLALEIATRNDDDASDAVQRAPRRPDYARNLPVRTHGKV
jgi:hypothetical protein